MRFIWQSKHLADQIAYSGLYHLCFLLQIPFAQIIPKIPKWMELSLQPFVGSLDPISPGLNKMQKLYSAACVNISTSLNKDATFSLISELRSQVSFSVRSTMCIYVQLVVMMIVIEIAAQKYTNMYNYCRYLRFIVKCIGNLAI